MQGIGQRARWLVRSAVMFAAAFAISASPASAGTGEEISSLSTLDDLQREEYPLSNGGKWGALPWAEGGGEWTKGEVRLNGWGPWSTPYSSNGAYWKTKFNDWAGNAAAVTLQASPGVQDRWASLLLNMPSPETAHSGYQLRWTLESNLTTYNVKLIKWSSGTEAVLASSTGVEIPVGTTLAISDTGGTVSAWKGTSSLTSFLSASDTTYSSGYAGIEGKGVKSRSSHFKAGHLGGPPETTIVKGSKGRVSPNVGFSFTSSDPEATFECSGAGFGAGWNPCTSPATTWLEGGSWGFSVRAVSQSGTDPTPASRSFETIKAWEVVENREVLDTFLRSEDPLAVSTWSRLGWANFIGRVWDERSVPGGKVGYGSYTNTGELLTSGAYWNAAKFDDEEEAVMVAANVGSLPLAGQYMSLWLNMPDLSPETGHKSGYEARISTNADGSTKLEIARWTNFVRTVLATKNNVSLGSGTVLFTESGGNLSVLRGKPHPSYEVVLTGYDATYGSGYAGLEATNGKGTLNYFRAGHVS